MSDSSKLGAPDDQLLSDDQLSEIAGGGGKPGMISINFPCDVCGELFSTVDALDRHKRLKHSA